MKEGAFQPDQAWVTSLHNRLAIYDFSLRSGDKLHFIELLLHLLHQVNTKLAFLQQPLDVDQFT